MKSNRDRKILIYVIFIFGLMFFKINVFAETLLSTEVPNSSYIIGSYVFTRDINDNTGYDGKLSTGLIMLASKTIDSNNLSDMVIYYKTATGKWINGLNGENITPPLSFNINYINLALEENNDTVVAPKAPIIYLYGPKYGEIIYNFSEETEKFSYDLYLMVDDISNDANKIDGVELQKVVNGQVIYEDLSYEENFTYESEVTEFYKGDNPELIVGNKYHSAVLTINHKPSDSATNISLRAYRKDGNGKKYYSDWKYVKIDYKTDLPKLSLNSNFIKNEGDNLIYSLSINLPDNEMFSYYRKDSPDDYNARFAYVLYDGEGKQLGVYNLSTNAVVSVPKDMISSYKAELGYYGSDNELHLYTRDDYEENDYLKIDTRTLLAPTLTLENRGEQGYYYSISQSKESTLDTNVTYELYEVYSKNDEIIYEYVDTPFIFGYLKPKYDSSQLVVRAYAYDTNGKKVYSDFSEFKKFD